MRTLVSKIGIRFWILPLFLIKRFYVNMHEWLAVNFNVKIDTCSLMFWIEV